MRGRVVFLLVQVFLMDLAPVRADESEPPAVLVLDGSEGLRLPWIARILAEQGMKKYRVAKPKKAATSDRLLCKSTVADQCSALAGRLRLRGDPAELVESHSDDIVISLSARDPSLGGNKRSSRRGASLVDRAVPIVLPRKGFEMTVNYSRMIKAAVPEEVQAGEGQSPNGVWTSGLRVAAGFGPADVFMWTPLQQGGVEREGLVEESTDPNGLAAGGVFAFGADIGLTGWGEPRGRKAPDHAFRGGVIYRLGQKEGLGARAHPHFQMLRGGTTAFFTQQKGLFGGFVGKSAVTTSGAKGGFFYGVGYGYDFTDKNVRTQDFQVGGGMFITIMNVVAPMLEAGLSGIRMSYKDLDATGTILDFQLVAGFRAFPLRNLFIFASAPLFEFISFDMNVGSGGSIASEDKGSFTTLLAGIGLRF